MALRWYEIATLVAAGALIGGACFIGMWPELAYPARIDQSVLPRALEDGTRMQAYFWAAILTAALGLCGLVLKFGTRNLRRLSCTGLLACLIGAITLNIPQFWFAQYGVPRHPDALQDLRDWANTVSTIGALIFLAGMVLVIGTLVVTRIQSRRRAI